MYTTKQTTKALPCLRNQNMQLKNIFFFQKPDKCIYLISLIQIID